MRFGPLICLSMVIQPTLLVLGWLSIAGDCAPPTPSGGGESVRVIGFSIFGSDRLEKGNRGKFDLAGKNRSCTYHLFAEQGPEMQIIPIRPIRRLLPWS